MPQFENVEERKRLYELLRFLRFQYWTMNVQRLRFRLDVTDYFVSRSLFAYGVWEVYETELLLRLLRPGSVFIDIGAHIGYYSLMVARQMKGDGRVIGFEPAPRNFDFYQRNIRLNGMQDVICAENLALSDHRGQAELHLNGLNSGDHRLAPSNADDDRRFNSGRARKKVQVEMLSLDEYCEREKIERVDLIKIDVQGAELAVYKGMKRTLERNPRAAILTEFWPHGLRSAGSDPAFVLDYLRGELGLELFQIRPLETSLVPVEREAFLEKAGAADPSVQNDLLCTRSVEVMRTLGISPGPQRSSAVR